MAFCVRCRLCFIHLLESKCVLASPTTHQSFMLALSLSKTKKLSKRLLERLTALYHSPCWTRYKIYFLFVWPFFLPGGVFGCCLAMVVQPRRVSTFFLNLRKKTIRLCKVDRLHDYAAFCAANLSRSRRILSNSMCCCFEVQIWIFQTSLSAFSFQWWTSHLEKSGPSGINGNRK